MITREEYDKYTKSTHNKRMKWFRNARFGMFIHYGLFAIDGMGEWELVHQNMDETKFREQAKHFMPKEGCVDEWVRLAKKAGAKYVVMTTRHHEGFSLWDSKVNPYNSMNYCGRDLVREFVDACHKYKLKIGLYSSLMDWHHPDSWKCVSDEDARKRFIQYIEDLNVELLSNYGKIDILWYDMSWPLDHSQKWDSVNRNYKLRQLQPGIIINNRSKMPEDFFTPEESLNPEDSNSDWEACMTFNKISWGYINEEQAKNFTYSAQQIARMLTICTKSGGNLLLNIGPRADGTLPDVDKKQLIKFGKWIKKYKEAFYGIKKRCNGSSIGGNAVTGAISSKDGKSVYLVNYIWPNNGKLIIGGYIKPPERITELSTGEEFDFTFEKGCITINNLPEKTLDTILGIPVFKMEFDEPYEYCYGYNYPQIHNGIPFNQ